MSTALAIGHTMARLGGYRFSPAALFAGGAVSGAWYDPSDLSTLFDSSAGTTPVSMPGQGAAVPVGLMLDKSQNGVGTNGAKRVNLLTYSEEFDNAAWTKTDATAANTSATTDPLGGTTAEIITALAGTAGKFVRQNLIVPSNVTFSVYAKADTQRYIQLMSDGDTEAYANFDLQAGAGQTGTKGTKTTSSITDVGNGWYRCVATFTGATAGVSARVFFVDNASALWFANSTTTGAYYLWGADLRLASEANTAPTYQRITNAWYSTLPGNHAIAFNNTTARPELRARVNLLTYSEDQSNGVWSNYSATQQSNVGIAPDGTNTADKIVEASGSSLQARYQTLAGGLNILHTVSAYAKADQRNVFNLSYSGVGNTNWFAATFELTGNGSVTKTGAGAAGTYTSSSIIPVGNGWYFCTVTGNPGQASTHYAYGGPSDTNNPTYGNFGVLTYSGNTANGVLVWGFDVRPANIGANVPAYQRIADANTYDTNGFPLYLRFDGIDDSMYTPANLNLSGTDKVAVFAGVRKLSTAFGTICETGAGSASGSFALFSNYVADDFAQDIRGSGAALRRYVTYAAPITNVYSNAITSAFADSAAAQSCRINGIANAGSALASASSTGNFASRPLNLGARNAGASLFFNGHLYSLAVVGSAVSAGNIAAMENWVAGKTGIVI